jgi:hypothetical protein
MLESPDRYSDVLDRLYHAFWYEKKGVQLPAIHKAVIAEVVGEEMATRIMKRVSSSFELERRYCL